MNANNPLAMLKRMVRMVVGTQPVELTCDACFEQMDRYAEMELAGQDPARVLPLVHDHLSKCRDCRQEYSALRAALQSLA